MIILSDNFTSKSCKEVKDVDCKISYQLFNYFSFFESMENFVNKTGYWFSDVLLCCVLEGASSMYMV